MAQQQIALQQIRTGKQRDLPDALEKGQLGFSTDVGRMFVGLPSSSDPASLVAGRNWDNAPNSGKENVEIITEFTPWQVVSNIVNRPYVFSVPKGGSTQISIQSDNRVFLDYMAYNDTSSILESGNVQMLCNDSKTLLAQFNNTTQEEGIMSLTFSDATFDESTKLMVFTITNNDTESDYSIEFVYRGWDKP